MYSETKVRIFNSLNSCLQDVLELNPTIEFITRFAAGRMALLGLDSYGSG